MKKQLTSLSISTFFAVLLSASFYSVAYAALLNPIDPIIPPNAIICGDGELEVGEQCDDGNTFNTDACLNTCRTAKCGDGFTRAGVEQCDDGNTIGTDACTNTCRTAVCGDGIIRTSVEQCDDGNTTSGDGCSSTCVEDQVIGPVSNPPGGTITPTFSGLIINGLATILGNLDLGGDLTVYGASRFGSMLLSGNLAMHGTAQIYTDNVHTTDVTASGDITSSYGGIGSFYTKWNSLPVSTSGSHYVVRTGCDSGDQLTGCSAYFSHDSTSDRFLGSYIGTSDGLTLDPTAAGEQCVSQATDGGGGDDMLYVFARCFDPAGTKNGKSFGQ